jgi:DNA-binding transcriptional regulator YiaG
MDGADIKKLRKQLGLTQEEFAHKIGVTFATVNRWENVKSKPSRLALRILEALNEKVQAGARKSSPKSSKKSQRTRRSS